VSVQADVTLGRQRHVAGVVARYSGTGVANMYMAALMTTGGTTFAQIYRNINGAWTLLSSQAILVSSATIRFDVTGSSLKLFVNGVLQTQATDTLLTTGSVGLFGSQGNTLDNFSAQ